MITIVVIKIREHTLASAFSQSKPDNYLNPAKELSK